MVPCRIRLASEALALRRRWLPEGLHVVRGETWRPPRRRRVLLRFFLSVRQLRSEMEAAGLKAPLPHFLGGIFAVGLPSAAVARDEVELLPPAYVDDTALYY